MSKFQINIILIKMEDLPLVPAMKIFDYLSFKDIMNMKLVSKWFYQIINENVRIKELVISNHHYVPCNRRWFYTCDLISLQNLYENYFNMNQPFLSQLKQLFIYDIKITSDTLNSLDRLVHLEIIDSYIYSKTDKKVLRLPMLEILNLHLSGYNDVLLIDSTKLQRLKLYSKVALVYPDSIIYLEVDLYQTCEKFLPSCINLQHFYCQVFDLVDLEKFNFIKKLSNLKSIHFDEPERALYSFVKEKKCFNKDLKIYFLNTEFEELPDRLPVRQFCNISFLDLTFIKAYGDYSRLASHCPFVRSVRYKDLKECFDQIPENLMKRFVNLTNFSVNEEISDLDQLIRVLGESKTITNLTLPLSLGQDFFNFHLHNLCPNINTLKIFGEEILNCEFILKFKYIRQFSVF